MYSYFCLLFIVVISYVSLFLFVIYRFRILYWETIRVIFFVSICTLKMIHTKVSEDKSVMKIQ